eukprot:356948_1
MSRENRTELLYKQLKVIAKALNGTDYYLTFGSLIGVMRDNGINPNEVDNDIAVNVNWHPNDKLKLNLWQNGLIVFLQDIYRICYYGDKSDITIRNAPWSGDFTVYTDLYKLIPSNVRPRPSLPLYKKPMFYEFVKLRDIYVRVPRQDIAMELLTLGYGNWNESYTEPKNSWKSNWMK